MSITAAITVAVNLSGENIQEGNVAPMTYMVSNSPATVYQTTTASGSTTILVPQLPTPTTWMRIVPPSSSSVSKFLMNTSGDTVGFQIATATDSWITISPSQTQFILRASGVETIKIFFW